MPAEWVVETYDDNGNQWAATDPFYVRTTAERFARTLSRQLSYNTTVHLVNTVTGRVVRFRAGRLARNR